MLLDRYDVKVYQSGLKFVLFVAVKNILKCEVTFPHSLDKGLYTKINTPRVLNADDIETFELKEKNKSPTRIAFFKSIRFLTPVLYLSTIVLLLNPVLHRPYVQASFCI